MRSIVAYFSAEAGITRRVAEELAERLSAEIFEIKPEKPYSEADLKWTNPLARCNREKLGKKDVPVSSKIKDWADYDTVFLGFPIWWYREPSIIDTFMESYDFTGKTIIPFCTSGGSGIEEASANLQKLAPGAQVETCIRVDTDVSAAELEELISQWI